MNEKVDLRDIVNTKMTQTCLCLLTTSSNCVSDTKYLHLTKIIEKNQHQKLEWKRNKIRLQPMLATLSKAAIFIAIILTSILQCSCGMPPRIKSNDVQMITGYLGETMVLPCLITGHPKLHSRWKKDGTSIDNSWKRYKQQQLNMKIKNLQTEDDGLYQCIATNGFGTTYVQIQLSVEEKAEENAAKTNKKPKLKKPYFSRPVKMRQLTIIKPCDATVKLKCKANGKPRPKIEWFKDGNLTFGSTSKTRQKRPQWTLVLRHVQPNASGRYKCRVWNSEGEITYEYTLRVIGKDLERPVLVSPHPVNTTVSEGKIASLQCRIRSEHKPTVKWVKKVNPNSVLPEERDQAVQIGESAYMILPIQPMMQMKDGTYLSKYTVKNADHRRDSGLYICLALNVQGFNFRYAFLSVHPRISSGSVYSSSNGNQRQFSLLLTILLPTLLAGLVVLVFTVYCLCKRDKFEAIGGSLISRSKSSKQHPPITSLSILNSAPGVQKSTDQFQITSREEDFSSICNTTTDRRRESSLSPHHIIYPIQDHLTMSLPGYESSIASGVKGVNATPYETEMSDSYITPYPPPPSPPSQCSRSSTARTDVTSSIRSLHTHHRSHKVTRHHHHHHHRCNEHHSRRCLRSFVATLQTADRYLTGASSTEPSINRDSEKN